MLAEVRQATRSLLRTPAFTATAILTLTLAMSASPIQAAATNHMFS